MAANGCPVYKYKSRSFLELCVAKKFSLHIVLCLRRDDIPWFNDKSNVASHERQILSLIKEDIVPREFPFLLPNDEENEQTNESLPGSKRQRKGKAVATAGGKKKEVVIGSANLKQKARRNASSKKTIGTSRGRQNNSSTTSVASVASEMTKNDGDDGNKEVKRGTYVPDVTMIFGDTLQMTYQTEKISQSSVTLRFGGDVEELMKQSHGEETSLNSSSRGRSKRKRPTHQKEQDNPSSTNGDGMKTKLATFQQLRTLPKRIICWCYPFDANDPTAPNPLHGEGFPCPETIPISSLFIEPSRDE